MVIRSAKIRIDWYADLPIFRRSVQISLAWELAVSCCVAAGALSRALSARQRRRRLWAPAWLDRTCLCRGGSCCTETQDCLYLACSLRRRSEPSICLPLQQDLLNCQFATRCASVHVSNLNVSPPSHPPPLLPVAHGRPPPLRAEDHKQLVAAQASCPDEGARRW